MTPLSHRDPGVVGAVLESDEVAAEIVCDGVHVHPAAVRVAVAAKGVGRMMAITDGTAGSGLPRGTRSSLGGRPITLRDAAYLDDGTLAGSVLTMDRAFARLVANGASASSTRSICARRRRPASCGFRGPASLAAGALADFVVLDADLRVRETWIGGTSCDRAGRTLNSRNGPSSRPVYVGMTLHPTGSAVVLGAALVAAGCTVTVDSHSEILREEKRFAVDGRADVRVTTFDGSIEVRAWDKPEVVIEIEKRGPTKGALDDLQILSEQKGQVIELEVKRPRSESFTGMGLHRSAYARLIVNVPRETDVRARSGDGAIRVERIRGPHRPPHQRRQHPGLGCGRGADARYRAMARSPWKAWKASSRWIPATAASTSLAGSTR